MMDPEQFSRAMLSWLNAKHAPPGVTIHAETRLFASGIIDSIKILELLAWTERAIGRPIPDVDIKLENFHSVERIAEVFAVETTNVTR